MLDMVELLIYGGTIVTASGTIQASIGIDNGKIVTITKSENVQADTKLDAKGLHILPGLVDTHVHFRDPGMTHKEDFLTGTRAAARGGTTTVVDMPTTLPTVLSKERLLWKVKAIQPKAIVDFALYGGAGETSLPEFRELAQAGVVGLKTYMVSPPPERAREYEGTFVTDAASLYRVMDEAKATNSLLCVHAEADSTIRYLTERLKREGRCDALAHFDSRPQFTETQAVSEALIMSEALGTRIHLLHLSTRGAVGLLRYWKSRGVAATAETCPHYLLLTKEALKEHGPYAKFNPPPRDMTDCEALWEGITDSTIDMVVSDHAPHSKAEKEAGREDIWKAPPGTPGVETRLPLLLSRVGTNIGLEDLVRLCATRPAKIFGLYPKKGEIAAGSDADLVLLDLGKEWVLRASELETKARETFLFEGWKVRGKPVAVYLRGRLIMKDDRVIGKPGDGEFLRKSQRGLEADVQMTHAL